MITVVGAGYVGLVTSACLAELGHDVTCVEIAPARLSSIQRGRLPVHEPGLDNLVKTNRKAGRLRFTSHNGDALAGSQFAFIAVHTPSGPAGQADTSFVFSAVRSVIERAPLALTIVVKSTVPIGTGDQIALLAAASRKKIDTVSNPEFLRQGAAIEDFLRPDRIVIGASSKGVGEAVAALYRGVDAPIMMCSRRSAELAKYASNALLAARISFMNEISEICEEAGADIDDVAGIVGADRRIGPLFLQAGLGWGGSCFPKDVLALIRMAVDRGHTPSLLQSVFEVNMSQRERAFDKLCAVLDGARKPTVGVLGLAFKANTDDIRGSPALDIAGRLLERGIEVRAHDPVAVPNARLLAPKIQYCADAYEVAEGSDAILLATEWRDYLSLNWEKVLSLMRGRALIDGRNVLDGESLSRIAFQYLSFGRHLNGASEAQDFAAEPTAVDRRCA
jgi:UDPglucose 6-dehydrogenase